MAFSSMAMMGAGAVNSAVGSYFSARNQRTNLQLQADLADINARASEKSAQQELARGQAEVGQLTLRAGQMKSAQRVAMAANGVVMGEGTAAEIAGSTELMKEIDKATIEANAVRSAWGYRTQGTNYQNQALMNRATASGISPFGSAANSLLGSAGAVAGQWYQLNRAGAFNSPSNMPKAE